MWKKLLIVLVVVFALVAILISRDYESPELGQSLLDQVGDLAGVRMTAQRFRLNLLRGVELEDVEAATTRRGREVTVRLDRLRLAHRIMPLLSGTLAVDEVVLERPEIDIIEPSASESQTETTGDTAVAQTEGDQEREAEERDEDGGPFAPAFKLEVQRLLVRDGGLTLRRQDDKGTTRLEGIAFRAEQLTFDPALGALAGIAGQGDINVDKVLIDDYTIRDTAGEFRMDNAEFVMPALRFQTEQGPFTANMQVDLEPVPFTYRLQAQGTPLDLNTLLDDGGGFGPANIELSAEGAGTHSRDVTAEVRLQLGAGQLPAAPLTRAIDRALGKTVAVGAPYQATEAVLVLGQNLVTITPFRFTTEIARLELGGTVDLDGPMKLAVELATERDGIRVEGTGADVLDLLTDEQGWVTIPLQVTGKLSDPTVLPDLKTLLEQAARSEKRDLRRQLEEKAADALRELIDRAKKRD